MSETAKRTNPRLWNRVKREITDGAKGGKPGQWSARKAQMAVSRYKQAGGGYAGAKSEDNSLVQWTEEDWGTRSGRESGRTGERYLPKAARKTLSKDEYDRTTAKKRADSRKGAQFSRQPEDVAEKTAKHRRGGERSKETLYAEAKRRDIAGRSRMSKAELERALG